MSGDSRPTALVTSATNPTIKLARSLHRRRFRERERALLVEGTRALDAALKADAQVRAVLIDEARRDSVPADLLKRLSPNARVIEVDPPLFASVALTEHPQALVAVVDWPAWEAKGDATLVLIVDGVRDPGNLGTLIRSAAAVGADAVALVSGTADPTNPKTVRATAGSFFAIPVLRFPSVRHAIDALFDSRPLVAIADAEASQPYDAVDWRHPTAVVIGGEAFGASDETRTFADTSVAIPIDPAVESLNAGVAASILLFEIARQRRRGG